MSEQNTPKVGAKLSARVNMGDYNWIELTEWVEDRVRPGDGSTSNALDRINALLDEKLRVWSEKHIK